jgi:hypothetical protein
MKQILADIKKEQLVSWDCGLQELTEKENGTEFLRESGLVSVGNSGNHLRLGKALFC